MTSHPHSGPAGTTPRAPAPPEKDKAIAPNLGRDQPGRGLDTGVDIGAIQPGGGGDSAALDH